MPKSPEDVINDPIKPDDFRSTEEMGMDDDLELNDEVDPIGDEALEEFDDEDFGMNDEDFDDEIEMDVDSDMPIDIGIDAEEPNQEMVAPEAQVKWTAAPQDNGDLVSHHVNGFILMARPLSAQQGSKTKYVSRLSRDGKVIESGVIWIDSEADAMEYLQNVADRILDRTGLINKSKEEAEPEPAASPEENADEDFGGIGVGGGDAGIDVGGDFDLEGEDVDVEADLGMEEGEGEAEGEDDLEEL